MYILINIHGNVPISPSMYDIYLYRYALDVSMYAWYVSIYVYLYYVSIYAMLHIRVFQLAGSCKADL